MFDVSRLCWHYIRRWSRARLLDEISRAYQLGNDDMGWRLSLLLGQWIDLDDKLSGVLLYE